MNLPTLSTPHPLTEETKRRTTVANAAYDKAFASPEAVTVYRREYEYRMKNPANCGGAAKQYAWEARRAFAIEASSQAVRAAGF